MAAPLPRLGPRLHGAAAPPPPPVSQFLLPRLRHPLGTRKLRGRPGNHRGRRRPDVRPPRRAPEPRAARPRVRSERAERAPRGAAALRNAAPCSLAAGAFAPVGRRTAAPRGEPGVVLRSCPAAFPSFPVPLNSLHSQEKIISSC